MIARGKKIYLCRPDKTLITQLNGVVIDSVNYNTHTKDYDTLSFTVDEYIIKDDEKISSNGYELLDVYMNLYLEDIGYFQMQTPSKNNDGVKETKSITAYSLEKEFEQRDWTGLKVNTGEPDSLEQLAENNLNELGFAKEFVVLYRPDKKDLSLLHLILTKMPGWSIIDDDIDPILWNKKIRIEEENINLYALLTSVIAPKLECIFIFDTINSRIKAVSKERLNDYVYDTNIFIGFRNLSNSVNVNVDEDSVYTRFNCKGDEDLSVNNWNYNDSRIVDLSYFLREPYMNKELISKVNSWIQWREDNREAFANLSKQRADINDKIYEIKYRVPNDGNDWSQWDDMTEELLYENLNYYNALLTSLQVSVDANPQYDANEDYIPWKKSDGTVNHDAYLELLYDSVNGYGGYYTYYEALNYIIPNIEIAISNLGVVESEKHDYIKEYETNWELYGIEELVGKKEDYENRLDVLKPYSKSWSELTNEEKTEYANNEAQYNASGRSEYVEITRYLGNETTKGTLLYQLKKLNDEVDSLEIELKTIDTDRTLMVEQSQFEHESYGFTNQDIVTIHTLFHDTDYTNTNILTTSVDTTLTTIDREKELFDDAISKLSEVSQPQFNFTVDLDNLLQIPEFKNWVNDFKLLNFIRVGLKDDYSVKVRMVGYSYNPCDITSDLNIEFSSMITSRSGRTDLTDILNNENNRGSKNSISIGTGNSDSDKEYLTSLLKLMVKNKIFKNAVGNITGDTVVAGSATIDEAEIKSLVSKYIKAEKIDVGQITGDEASFNKFFADYIDADVIVGDSADFKELNTIIANIKNAIIGSSSTETGIVFNLSAANAKIDEAWISDLVAGRISVADLEAHNATADQITLISSEDGAPTIAFKDSTQQFYDSDGNVRVQIGQDGEGNFNFVVRGEDGTTALFDETGIKKEGIPENTIVNDMIEDNTIEKTKLGFKIVEANEHGGVDITQIYDGDESFGVEYSSFKQTVANDIDAVVKSIDKIDEIRETISGVSSKVDQNTKSITDKVWQTDITKEIDEYDNVIGQSIRDRLTQTETDISGVKTTVSSVESELNNKADGFTVQELNTKISQVEQDAENFKVTISETYATKQNVSDSINDIEIGGRNLIPNSNFANGTDGWVGQSYTLTSLTDSNYGHVLRISSNGTSAGSTTKIYVDKNKFVHESNTTYTLSFMAKNSTGSSLAIISSVVGLANSKSYKTKTHAITTQWAKYTYTYTTGTLSNDAVLAFWLNMPGLVYITNIKLEKGTKSTDWTPAPEDVQGQIDNNVSVLSNHETRINANQSSIELQVQSLEEYKDEVSSRFTETNTSILALDGKIENKVEQVHINNAIDGIDIGGRNLVIGTSTADITDWYHYGWGGSWITYSKEDRIYRLNTSNGWRVAVYDMSDYVGENITISCDVLLQSISTNTEKIRISISERSDSTNTGSQTLSHHYTIDTTDTWYHYEGTITLSKPYLGFYIRGTNSDAGTGDAYVLFKNIKFEKGNKATDWTPAPEDVDASISHATSIATQTAEKFEWMVRSDSSMSSLVLTDTMLAAITDQFKVVGSDGSTTIISGGTMNVNNIFAQDIVANGSISGVTLHGVYGEIGGWNIDSNCLYSSYTDTDGVITTVVLQNTMDNKLFSHSYVSCENCTATIQGIYIYATPIETSPARVRITTPLKPGRTDMHVYSGYTAKYDDTTPGIEIYYIDENGDENFELLEFAEEWGGTIFDIVDGAYDNPFAVAEINFPIDIPEGATKAELRITHYMPQAKADETYAFKTTLNYEGVFYEMFPMLSAAGVTIDKFLAVKKESDGNVHIPFYVTGDGYLYTENAHITGNSTFSGQLLISDDTGRATEINAEGNIIMTDSVVDYSRSPLYVQLNHQHYRTTLDAYGLSTMFDMNDNFTTPEQYTLVGPARIIMGYADKTWQMLMNPDGSVNVTGNLTIYNGSTQTPLFITGYAANESSIRYSYNGLSYNWVVGPGAGYNDFSKFGFYKSDKGALVYIDTNGSIGLKGEIINNNWAFGDATGTGEANTFGFYNYSTGLQATLSNTGIFTAASQFNAGGKIAIFADNEGGNLQLVSPNGTVWEMDAYANDFIRLFNYNTLTAITFNSLGQIGCLGIHSSNSYNVLGSFTLSGAVISNSTGCVISNGSYAAGLYGTESNFRTNMENDNVINMGTTSSRWKKVYAASGTIGTSDERDKNIIGSFDQRHRQLFMKLKPIIFTWKDENADKDVHFGLGAQTTRRFAEECGITMHEIAAIEHGVWDEPSPKDGRTDRYGMAYDEIHMLTIPIVQTHEITLTEHASKLVNIESQLESLKTELDEAHIEIARLKKLANIS